MLGHIIEAARDDAAPAMKRLGAATALTRSQNRAGS